MILFNFYKFRWIWLFASAALAIMRTDGLEILHADSDYGEIILVANDTDGQWSVLYGERGIYFDQQSDGRHCFIYHGNCWEHKYFRPTVLKIRLSSQSQFPVGLFQPRICEKVQRFQFTNIGIREFHRSGLLGAYALNSLNLSHNAITELPSNAFTNAVELAEIDLSYNHIATLPSNVFKVETEKLSTVESPYYTINTTQYIDAPLRFLKVIHLNHNNLTFVDQEWFSDLVNLTTLTLNDNFLAEIDGNSVFATNPGLRTLHLQNNQLSAIIRLRFLDGVLNQLDSFDISNNQIAHEQQPILVEATIMNLSNTNLWRFFIPDKAVILRADHNLIGDVPDSENTNLTELYLNHNLIQSADFLQGLEGLEVIDLSHNRLNEINANVFAKILNLTVLNLSHNWLETIDFTFLTSTPNLNSLDISKNLLSGQFNLSVNANALARMNISGNYYTSFESDLKIHAPNLITIDLNDNNFDCDDLSSLILFMNFDRITPVIRSDYPVGSRNHVRGIKCHRKQDNLNEDAPTRTSNIATQDSLIKTMDDKFENLEAKLIGLIRNLTTYENVDN